MADGKYTFLTVKAVDGSQENHYDIYKATKVENFKRIIKIKSLDRIEDWEDITLFQYDVELKDDSEQTLESYGLGDGSIIRCVVSSGAPRKPKKKQSTQSDEAPPPPYKATPEESVLLQKRFTTVFARDIDTGRTLNLVQDGAPEFKPTLGTKIQDLRKEVARRQGTEAVYIRMIYSAKELEDVNLTTKEPNTLMTYGYQDEGTIHVVLRLPGGSLENNRVDQ